MRQQQQEQVLAEALPAVTIVVVYYSNQARLADCVKSVVDSGYHNYELILVDNGSPQPLSSSIQELAPGRIRLLRNQKNLRLIGASNRAIRQVRSKYIFLLNDDTMVARDCLDRLVAFAEKYPAAGALQPKLLWMSAPDFFEYNGAAGGFIDSSGVPFCRGRLFNLAERDFGQYDLDCEIFWAGGACIFLRREAVEKVGLYDDTFVQMMEEIDLSWRMQLAGYRIYSVPEAVVLHAGGSVSASFYAGEKFYWKQKNNLCLMTKNQSLRALVPSFMERMVYDSLSVIVALRRSRVKRVTQMLRAYTDFLFSFRVPWAKHLQIQKMKKTPDSEIRRRMLGKSCAIQFYLLGRKTFSRLSRLPRPIADYVKLEALKDQNGKTEYADMDNPIYTG
jgi:GT2 family glycosyltransferase